MQVLINIERNGDMSLVFIKQGKKVYVLFYG